MNATAVVEGCSPIWADYVWLARSSGSRLYPIVREFLAAIEAASRSISLDALTSFKRATQQKLTKSRRKHFIYSLCGMQAKKAKYYDRIVHKPRALRDAAVNVGVCALAGGPLSRIMHRCGSDKGDGRHNYASFYEMLFHKERDRVTRIFELGIGTMGANGAPGASLKGWKEYFPNAIVFGGDINEQLLFEENRIKTAVVDQTEPESIHRMFDRFGGEFDVMIDDGCHQMEPSRVLFQHGFPQLKTTGIYIIEDIVSSRRNDYKTFLDRHDAAILEIPHETNHYDNCLAIVVKDLKV
jgi:hypothetical protein